MSKSNFEQTIKQLLRGARKRLEATNAESELLLLAAEKLGAEDRTLLAQNVGRRLSREEAAVREALAVAEAYRAAKRGERA